MCTRLRQLRLGCLLAFISNACAPDVGSPAFEVPQGIHSLFVAIEHQGDFSIHLFAAQEFRELNELTAASPSTWVLGYPQTIKQLQLSRGPVEFEFSETTPNPCPNSLNRPLASPRWVWQPSSKVHWMQNETAPRWLSRVRIRPLDLNQCLNEFSCSSSSGWACDNNCSISAQAQEAQRVVPSASHNPPRPCPPEESCLDSFSPPRLCQGANLQLPGQAKCEPLDTCGVGPWPPSTGGRQTIYVKQGRINGQGSQTNPYGSLTEALATLSGPTTILLA